MITGVHAIFYTTDTEATRASLRDKMDLPHYGAAEDWPLFTADGDIGCHPAGSASREICFRRDDTEATVGEMQGRGVQFTEPIDEQAWGFRTFFALPGLGPVQLYEPKYERP